MANLEYSLKMYGPWEDQQFHKHIYLTPLGHAQTCTNIWKLYFVRVATTIL